MAVIRKYKSNIGQSLQPIASGSTARVRLSPAEMSNLASAPYESIGKGLGAIGEYAAKVELLDQEAQLISKKSGILAQTLRLKTYHETSPHPVAFDNPKLAQGLKHPVDQKPLETFSSQWKKVREEALSGVTSATTRTKIKSDLAVQEMKLRSTLYSNSIKRVRQKAVMTAFNTFEDNTIKHTGTALETGKTELLENHFKSLQVELTNQIGLGALTSKAARDFIKVQKKNIARMVFNKWSQNKNETELINALKTGNFKSSEKENENTDKVAKYVFDNYLKQDPVFKDKLRGELLKMSADRQTANVEEREIKDVERKFHKKESEILMRLTEPLKENETRTERIKKIKTELSNMRKVFSRGKLGAKFNKLLAILNDYGAGFAINSDSKVLTEGITMSQDTTLTYDWLLQNKGSLSEKDYHTLIQKMSGVTTAAKRNAEEIIKRATKIDLLLSSGMSFTQAEKEQITRRHWIGDRLLQTFLRDNRRASYEEIQTKAEDIANNIHKDVRKLITKNMEDMLERHKRRMRRGNVSNEELQRMTSLEDVAKYYERKNQKLRAKRLLKAHRSFTTLLQVTPTTR